MGEFNFLSLIKDPIWIAMIISFATLIGITYLYMKTRAQLTREEDLKSYEKTFGFNIGELINVEDHVHEDSSENTDSNTSTPHSDNDSLNSEITIRKTIADAIDSQKKLNLGEIALIRQNIEREMNLLYYKFFSDERWVNPTQALRKLAALIQNSNLSEELQQDGHNSYNQLRRITGDLNMAIHEYPWKIEIEQNAIETMKKDSKEYIELLKKVLSHCE